MKGFVKQMFVAVILLSCTIGARAQEKKFENCVFLSAGRFIDQDTDTVGTQKGQTKKIGYGLDFYLTENYSVMAAVVSHYDTEKSILDPAEFIFVDVPILFEYHTTNNGLGNLMIGAGPVFSRCIHNDYYEIEGDTYHGLNHKKKIKEFNFSLMPCIAYETRFLRLGVDANIGLRDMKRVHKGLTTGQKHLHDVCFTLTFKI